MSISTLQQIIEDSGNIVFFGGAGVSTESGLPDFRSQNGLYAQKFKYPPETMLSRSFFDSHTEEFFEFYKEKLLVTGISPNAAHHKLAEMERAGKLKAVITQNIDGLHQAAGSKKVIELHGSVHRNFCMACGKSYNMMYMKQSENIPHCECGGVIKPNVVMYEEPLDQEVLGAAVSAAAAADVMIVGGTSLAVYPAASLLQFFRGEKLVLINKGKTPYDRQASLVIRQPIGQTLGDISLG